MKPIFTAMSRRSLLLLAGILTITTAPLSFSREWTSSDGKLLQGSFIKLTSDTLTLKGANGQPINLPLNVLKEEDQTYARNAQTFVDAAMKEGVKSFESGLNYGEGAFCRMGLARAKPTDTFLFGGQQFYLYTEPGAPVTKGTKFIGKPIFYTGERTLHLIQGGENKILSYATTVDRAMTAMSEPIDIYEPQVKIAEIRALAYPIGESGLLMAYSKSLTNASDIMIDLGVDLQPGTVLANNSALGIAIVSCKASVTAIHLAPRKPLVLGQPIVTLSLMLDKKDKRARSLAPSVSSKGTITSLSAADDPHYFEHDAPRDPDAIGGIVLSEQGDVLGIMAEVALIKRGTEKTSPFVAAPAKAGPLNRALRTDALIPYLKNVPKVVATRSATEADDLPGSLHKTAVTLRIARETVTDMTPQGGPKTPEPDAAKMRWSIGKGRLRHNSTCKSFDPNRPCKATFGKPCPKCGG